MGRDPPPASGGGCAEEGDCPAVEARRQDGAAGHRSADAAGAGVAAAAEQPGPGAKADPTLLDGIESAFRYYKGVVDRVVLDNTSLAVKDVLASKISRVRDYGGGMREPTVS